MPFLSPMPTQWAGCTFSELRELEVCFHPPSSSGSVLTQITQACPSASSSSSSLLKIWKSLVQVYVQNSFFHKRNFRFLQVRGRRKDIRSSTWFSKTQSLKLPKKHTTVCSTSKAFELVFLFSSYVLKLTVPIFRCTNLMEFFRSTISWILS